MMHKWQLQQAKAHLSEVVREALAHGPQSITLHGEPAVIVISKKDFDKLKQPKSSFIEFIRSSPLIGVDLELERPKSLTRDIDL